MSHKSSPKLLQVSQFLLKALRGTNNFEMLVPILTTVLLVALQVRCSPAGFRPDPFAPAIRQRETTSGDSSSTQVDLGYEVYNASVNSTAKLNIWRG